MASDQAAAGRERLVALAARLSVDILSLPPDEVVSACALFSSVFGHPIEPAHWHWKYHLGPRLGQINMAARDADGRWVGHAGAIVFQGVCGGRELPMAQVCDIMVERRARGGVGPGGVYARLVVALRQQLNARFPGVFAYGFPGNRPFRLGERIGAYRQLYVCHEARVTSPTASRWPALPWTAREVGWDVRHLDWQWQRLAPTRRAPAVARTGAYLGWRYRDHPSNVYRLWQLTRWFRDSGWLVTRAMPDGSQCVVDALLAHVAESPAACAALRRALVEAGDSEPVVRTWLPLPDATATGIVATEFLAGGWHTDLPPPEFQPGDTDVY